jgi:ATP-dependent helicase HrpB
MIKYVRTLPIDPLIAEIVSRLEECGSVVVEAPPGAGKTTRVPPAVLALGGEVLVLEPRRLAARMAASRVAQQFGEPVGETVGYQVRLDEAAGPRTRLRFLTEGVLARRLMRNPRLSGVSAVVLDEFHERHLEGDLALALLRRLQQTARRDLKLVVMSATLNAGPLAEYLGGCPVLRSEGRLFDLEVRWTPHSAAPLETQVAGAVEQLIGARREGDTLVFLPGAAEIRRAARACEPLVRQWGIDVLPLHGDLPPEEQDRAVTPGPGRKVILSTNVAESSITIDGVTAVIDSGLARVAEDSPWTGIPTLRVARISKASATQRAGRAGRTAPGTVVRLYSAEDFARRPDQEAPEIRRRELSQALLVLHAMGIQNAAELPWLEAPPAELLRSGEELLQRLGALDGAGRITSTGRRMAELPVSPRLARLVTEAASRGAGDEGCRAAAVLSEGHRLSGAPAHHGASDLFVLLESEWPARTTQLYRQLRRAASVRTSRGTGEEALLMAVLAAFPDRVARRRHARELQLANGGLAMLARESAVEAHDLLVAVDVEERQERGLPLVRIASAVEAEWLLDMFPERMRETTRLEWNRTGERVEQVSSLCYDDLVLESSRSGSPDPAEAARLLAAKALEAGVARFANPEELEEFLARVAFASAHGPVPQLGNGDVAGVLESACAGLRSFEELEEILKDLDLTSRLRLRLREGERRMLEELAPERLRLPGGRTARVRYARGKAPWVAAKLQEFFGVREGPRVARGSVPLVLHLLAPNMRPVQTTTDLAGFWTRLYPRVRRELMRRYPKHAWPEQPV